MTPGQLRERPTAAGTSIEVPGYELVKVIGRGSYGTVYLGRSASGQWRAIKVCRRDERNVKDLDREWRGLQRYEPVSRSTPGFLAILDLGEDSGGEGFYCVMELADDVSGEATVDPAAYEPRTLAYELKKKGHLELAEVLRLGITLGTALGRLHETGLVHRDVKPANIVYVGGQPKLADMGLVVAEAEANSLVGTPGYIPPEGPGKPSGDIYALGKVLYQALTGYEPARFPDPPTFLREHQDPTRFQEVMDVLAKASEERSARRHETVREMVEELELIQGGRSVRMLRDARAQRARWRRRSAVTMVLAAMAAALGLIAHRVNTLDQLQHERESAAMTSRSARLIEEGDYGQALIDQAELVKRTEGTPEERLARLRYALTLGQMPKLTALWAMEGAVSWCGFMPGDEQVLVTSRRGTIQLRQAMGGEIVRQWEANALTYMAVITSDGKWFATAQNGAVRLWNTDASEAAFTLPHPGDALAVCFHPTDPYLVTGAQDGKLRWWSRIDGSLLREIAAHSGRIDGLAIHPSGQLILTGGGDGRVRFWTPQGEAAGKPILHRTAVHHVSLSRDGRDVVVTCGDKSVHLWDVETRNPKVASMHPARVAGVAKFSPTGRVVATCGWDGYLRIWNVDTGLIEQPALRHRFLISTAGYSSDGRRIITGTTEGSVRIWDWAGRVAPSRLEPLAVSPRRRHMVVNDASGTNVLDLLNPASPSRRLSLGAGATVLAINDRGDRVAASFSSAGQAGSTTRLTDVIHGSSVGAEIPWPTRSVMAAFAPGDEMVALAGSNRVVVLSAAGETLWSQALGHRIRALAFSPDGSRLAAASGSNVVVWATRTGVPVGASRRHALEVQRMVFNGDGSRLIVCTGERIKIEASAKVWDLRAGSTNAVEVWHLAQVADAAWLEGEAYFATVSSDGSGRIWEAETGKLAGETMSHLDAATSVQASTNRLLLTAGEDGRARLWEERTGRPFGPSISYPFKLESASWLPDSSGFIAQQASKSAWYQPFTEVKLEAAELGQLARVLAGQPVAGGRGADSSLELAEAWRELKGKHPALFETTNDEIVAWACVEADTCQAISRSDAAVRLLDQALVLRPADENISERRREFESRGRATKAREKTNAEAK